MNKSSQKKPAPKKSGSTRGTTSSKKKSANNAARAKKIEEAREPSKCLSNQIIPYILAVAALFLAICFLLIDALKNPDSMGVVGFAVNSFLLGLFGFGAFLIPLLLIGSVFLFSE